MLLTMNSRIFAFVIAPLGIWLQHIYLCIQQSRIEMNGRIKLSLLVGVGAIAIHAFFFKSPGQSMQQIKPIDRVHEGDLTATTFLNKYVKTGTPVIIIQDGVDAYAGRRVDALLENCSEFSVPGISEAALYFFDHLTSWQHRLLAFFTKVMIGIDLQEWQNAMRSVSIADIHKVAKNETSLKKNMSKLVQLLPSAVQQILDLFANPMYLGDAQLSYSDALDKCKVGLEITQQEQDVRSMAIQMNDPQQDEKIYFFWGGIDSSYYPLHQDIVEGDVFMEVVSGCKEVVIVHPDESHKLTKSQIPGARVYINDLFESSRGTIDGHLEEAWKGTVSAGETLYMAYPSVHEVRNKCPTTVSLVRRPWLGKTFREIKD
jgi:hypothetical protein